ncbi:MAG TPA: DNA repair protein RecO [Saprospiraceae bacterium]|nr:DNA repair protein RecO [Saprospiraceae bacterium]
MLIKTRGIIFRAVKYSETSIIADIYTEEKGLRAYIISGVRKKHSKVSAGLLQVMSLVDMVAYYRNEKDLHRIKEIKAAHIYVRLPFDVARSAVGIFMIELARKTIRESEANPRLFHFLFSSFQFLDKSEHSVTNVHLHFMIQLSGFLGFMPGGSVREGTPFFDLKEGIFISNEAGHIHILNKEESLLLYHLLESPLNECHQIKMNKDVRRKLLNSLLDFYKLHIENFPTINAHLILQEVLG